ncbi:MAG: TonB-dependent receptor, partial [Acidobacteriia bacterium]|nr:TonB-dependent receptor [Terriglobia bacterium]
MRLVLALSIVWVLAAADAAVLSGLVEDTSGHPLANANVLVQSESTGARWRIQTDDSGRYQITGISPGRYKITTRLAGFRTVSRVGAAVEDGETARIDFSMELLGLHELITVESGRDALDPAAGSGLLLTRDSAGASLPANGGDYRVLFDLAPGVVITPAASSDGGQFASGGQRPNANTFRVDGISANTGVGSSILPGAFPGASLPAMTPIGTTEALVSNETAQSVELRSSDFSPEFSDRPGAESLVNTRSGTNSYHAEFFGNIRDNGWNARDWFANSFALESPRPSYDRLGFTAGGPILRNKTFFFLSAEGTRISDDAIQLTAVPSLGAHQSATGALQQVLSYYPEPIGPDLGGGQAVGLAQTYVSEQFFTASARVDQSLGSHGNFFARIVESPARPLHDAESQLISTNWASGTLGFTLGGSSVVNDFRVGYSRGDLLLSFFGGAPIFYSDLVFGISSLLGFNFPSNGLPAALTSVLPPAGAEPIAGLSIPGLGQFVSFNEGLAQQDQFEVRHTFSKTSGRHQFRAGADYVRLHPKRHGDLFTELGAAASLQSLLDNQPLAVTISHPAEDGGRIHEISTFAQDTFRISDRLNLLYGLAWDITPPVRATQIPTFSGLWTGSEWLSLYSGNINGTAPWPMRWGQLAPRVALAYRLAPDVVLRGGFGVFRDGTLGAAVNPINGAPFNSWLLSSDGAGPGVSATATTSTSTSSQSPDVKQFLAGNYPGLRLPTSYQWRLAVEKQLGLRGVGSLAYVGAVGRDLLGHEAYVDPATGILERLITLTTNSSSYGALEMRYSGSLSHNIYGSLSYTWAHSMDNGSLDSSEFLIHPGYSLNEARASSNFDVRQSVAAALSYRAPMESRSSPLPPWLAGWTVSGIFRARSGFPITVLSNEQPLGEAFDNVGRPDLVPGVPVWIADPSVAGGRRLNPAAFAVPPAGQPGTWGRNAITGNPLIQLDASLHRQFALFRGLSLEVGLNVFNVLNHPAFADPVPFLSSPWFG